ncbi:hypothetical protein CCP1ISM_50003 [Azospirillaceae bacterium]
MEQVDILKQLSDLHLSAEELANLKKEIYEKKLEKASIAKDIEILKKALDEQKRLNEIEQNEHLGKVTEIKGVVGKLSAQKDEVDLSTKLSIKDLEDKRIALEKTQIALAQENEKKIALLSQIQKKTDIVDAKIVVVKKIIELAKTL